MMDVIQAEDMHIRWLIRSDMERVLQIESEAVEYPWIESEIVKCLRQRNCIGMVIEPPNEKGCVARGYMIYELHKRKLHLIRIAVLPVYQRQGLGTRMIEKLKYKLSCERRNVLSMELSERNLDGQLFLREMGFLAVDVKRHWCDVTGDDGYVMEYRL